MPERSFHVTQEGKRERSEGSTGDERPQSRLSRLPFWRIGIGVSLVAVIVAAFLLLDRANVLAVLSDQSSLNKVIADLGWLGPAVVIGILALAIVVSPLPSAPIALAAGAAFGHIWGTVYVVIGAELGALVAFTIARLLGLDVLRHWFGNRLNMGLLGSQNALTIIVFVTRLLPFVSFDLVSYAAGLTLLRFWRFALATLAGIVPMSFLLTHFGGELASLDGRRIAWAALALGLVTALPLIGQALRRRVWNKRPRMEDDDAKA